MNIFFDSTGKKIKPLWLSIFSGLLLGFSFPPFNFYITVFAGLVIFLHVIDETVTFKSYFRRAYVVFFVCDLIAVSWLIYSGLRENADIFLCISGILVQFFHPLFYVIPISLFHFVQRKRKLHPVLKILFFAVIYTSADYLNNLSQFSFPWILLGNSFTYQLHKIQIVEIIGVFGLSFWAAGLSAIIFYFYRKLYNSDFCIRSPKSIFAIAIILSIYFAPDLYSSYFVNKSFQESSGSKKINIGIVQPNIDPWAKWGSKQDVIVNAYLDEIRDIKKKDSTVELIIFPETAIPFYILNGSYKDKFTKFTDLIDSINTPLLIGAPYYETYKNKNDAPKDARKFDSHGDVLYDSYNSALLITPHVDRDSVPIYKKMKLVIGAERIPYQEKLMALSNIISWGTGISAWQVGRDTLVFNYKENKFNSAICYESVYPAFFSNYVDKGAEFCTIITNDGWWWKFFGTVQHQQYAVLRAIENRRWIARSANTGISCFIDPYGNVFDKTPIYEKAEIIRTISLRTDKTFYTTHADLIPIFCIYMSLGLFGFVIVSRFLKKK
ncbi:apolipoprotein N-acyltransferase [soil metagenome]